MNRRQRRAQRIAQAARCPDCDSEVIERASALGARFGRTNDTGGDE